MDAPAGARAWISTRWRWCCAPRSHLSPRYWEARPTGPWLIARRRPISIAASRHPAPTKAWYERCRWSTVATSQQSVAAGVVVAGSPASSAAFSRGWARLVIPSFSDCFFIVLVVWLFLWVPHGWDSLLGDADVGWHIRTGEWILDHQTVPTADLFSFSKPGAPWFAWEWLSDVTLALLFRAAGLKAIVLLAGVVIGLYATVVLRHALWRGANAMIALPLVLLGVGSSMMHFLARPH